jgi:K+-sensing histidine kinase KdpD
MKALIKYISRYFKVFFVCIILLALLQALFEGDFASFFYGSIFMLLFYYFSKHKKKKNVGPIIDSIESLSHGQPVSLSARGELSEVAECINKASRIISRQNEARTNWINGVSHDVRTPLSMMIGYAGRIMNDEAASDTIKKQAKIIEMQGAKIKALIGDLNIVSQLEYEALPLTKKPVHMAKLLRTITVDLLNERLHEKYSFDLEILSNAEQCILDCDARLITRAVSNLTQNSIRNNPKGCGITISLDCGKNNVSIIVADNGVGFSQEKLKELHEKPHYTESLDERLDLRHGLGLLLVKQITKAHNGTTSIENQQEGGSKITMSFPKATG